MSTDPFVGRGRELSCLADLSDDVAATGIGRFAPDSDTAGAGETRICLTFLSEMKRQYESSLPLVRSTALGSHRRVACPNALGSRRNKTSTSKS